MKLCSKFFLNLLLLNSFIFLNCENFWGYNYDADPIPNSATITGKITHFFTNQPVPDATVQFGSQSAQTDSNGQYLLSYIFEGDEDRDKPVKVHVSAHNYYSKIDSTKIFPQINHYDAKLKYAAPIIQRAVIVDLMEVDSLLCQVHVTDYQGRQNISEITVSFFYLNNSKGEISVDKLPMAYHHSQGNWDLFYQLWYKPRDLSELPQSSFLELSEIFVKDFGGFSDSTTLDNFTTHAIELLFAP
jgi:hypothetical protein